MSTLWDPPSLGRFVLVGKGSHPQECPCQHRRCPGPGLGVWRRAVSRVRPERPQCSNKAPVVRRHFYCSGRWPVLGRERRPGLQQGQHVAGKELWGKRERRGCPRSRAPLSGVRVLSLPSPPGHLGGRAETVSAPHTRRRHREVLTGDEGPGSVACPSGKAALS